MEIRNVDKGLVREEEKEVKGKVEVETVAVPPVLPPPVRGTP